MWKLGLYVLTAHIGKLWLKWSAIAESAGEKSRARLEYQASHQRHVDVYPHVLSEHAYMPRCSSTLR